MVRLCSESSRPYSGRPVARARRQRRGRRPAMAPVREQESAEAVVPRATSRVTRRASQLGKGRTSQSRFDCQRLAGDDEAEWPSHRAAALAARAWSLFRRPIGTNPLTRKPATGLVAGEGQWRGSRGRWDDHRPVSRLCPATLAEDSFAPLSRHLSPGAGAPGVHPQAQRGLASPGHSDGPGPCHTTGHRAGANAAL